MRSQLWMLVAAGAVLGACGGGHTSSSPSQPPDSTGTTGPSGTTGTSGGPTPTSTACAGLLPDAPGPGVALRWPGSTGDGFAFCEDPITDGHGEWIGVGVGYKWFNYTFVSASD